jgi:hypothetical protein
MRLLRLVGPGEDGTSVVVEAVEPGSSDDARGERFELSLDDRLRAMATTEPASTDAPTASTEAEPASAGPVPTPREIQVRVRAGETAQAVADDAGIPLERVMRFAFPVLQERIRVTDEARRARARRGGDGLLVPFGELIDSRLGRHGVDPATVRWDAYRREDGGWTVTSEITSHERTLRPKFSFALLNRTVSALDDIAADLLSDRPVQALLPPPPPAPEPVAEESVAETPDWTPDWDEAPPPPRLTAVPNPSRVDEPRPQEASPAVRPPSRRQKAHTRPVPVPADDELFDQDAFEQQPWHEPQLPFEVGTGGRGSTQPSGSARHRARQSPRAAADSEVVTPAQPAVTQPAVTEPVISEPPAERTGSEGSRSPEQEDFAPAGDDAAGNDELVGARARGGDPQGRRGRRSGEKPRMPSWDDILLGVRHKSD